MNNIRTRIALSVAALAAATVVIAPPAAHSAGSTLTKAQVIQRGSAICKAGERKVNALPQIRSEHPFSKGAPKGESARAIRFLAGYADALAGVRFGLARLSLPTEDRALLQGFIAALGPTVAALRRAHADAAAGRYEAAEAEAQRAFGLFARASTKTAAYGFPRGVCQSG